MFRRIRKLVWSNRERLLSLVMLPAFVLTTLPHTACICADGHREEFCRAAACRAINSGDVKSVCCGCSCCKDRGSDGVRTCCKTKHQAPSRSVPADGLAAKPATCCQPVIAVPATAIKTKKVELESTLQFVTAIEFVTTHWGTDDFRPAIAWNSFATPPPLDAVIVFQHLTI